MLKINVDNDLWFGFKKKFHLMLMKYFGKVNKEVDDEKVCLMSFIILLNCLKNLK